MRGRLYVSDDIRYRHEPDSIVVLGTIQCEGGIRVELNERLRIVRGSSWFQPKDNPFVELVYYANNMVLFNSGTVFRYNSPHADHNPFHHVHRYDVFGDMLAAGEQIKPPERLHEPEVPTVREVMQEAERWYHANLGRLPKGS